MERSPKTQNRQQPKKQQPNSNKTHPKSTKKIEKIVIQIIFK